MFSWFRRKKNGDTIKTTNMSKDLSFFKKREKDYSEEEEVIVRRRPFSLLGNFIFLITVALLVTIGWGVCLTWIPQDLASIPGYRQPEQAPDIPQLLRKSSRDDVALTLTEEDINRYIASTLKASQNGILAPIARPHGVAVRLHNNYMEVIIERRIGVNILQTISLYMMVIQEPSLNSPLPKTRIEFTSNNTAHTPLHIGGKLGSLDVPQVYMYLTIPAFENLASAYNDIISDVIDTGRIIRISEGKVDLMPPSKRGF
jgi:hypothetical protein